MDDASEDARGRRRKATGPATSMAVPAMNRSGGADPSGQGRQGAVAAGHAGDGGAAEHLAAATAGRLGRVAANGRMAAAESGPGRACDGLPRATRWRREAAPHGGARVKEGGGGDDVAPSYWLGDVAVRRWTCPAPPGRVRRCGGEEARVSSAKMNGVHIFIGRGS